MPKKSSKSSVSSDSRCSFEYLAAVSRVHCAVFCYEKKEKKKRERPEGTICLPERQESNFPLSWDRTTTSFVAGVTSRFPFALFSSTSFATVHFPTSTVNRVTDYLHALPTVDYLRLRRDGVGLMKRDYLSILFLVSRWPLRNVRETKKKKRVSQSRSEKNDTSEFSFLYFSEICEIFMQKSYILFDNSII